MRRLRKLPKNYVPQPRDRTLFLVARSAIRRREILVSRPFRQRVILLWLILLPVPLQRQVLPEPFRAPALQPLGLEVLLVSFRRLVQLVVLALPQRPEPQLAQLRLSRPSRPEAGRKQTRARSEREPIA
jgi:hypothetical protein